MTKYMCLDCLAEWEVNENNICMCCEKEYEGICVECGSEDIEEV